MFNSYPGTVLRGNGLMSSTCPGTCPDVQMFRKSPSVSTEAGWAAGAELRSKNTPQVEKNSENCVRTEGSSRTEMETHNRQHQKKVCGSSSSRFLVTLIKLAQMAAVPKLPGSLDSQRMSVRSSSSSTSSSSRPPKSNLKLPTGFLVSFVTLTLSLNAP